MDTWQLRSGEAVVDRINSHITHHPEIVGALTEILGLIASGNRDYIEEDVDLRRVIGETICVETGLTDEIVYAQRSGRRGPSRFVKGRSPEPTSWATVVLKKDNSRGCYVIITAHLGRRSLEPWDPRATEADRKYWETHALVWGSQPIVEGTQTTACPW